MFYIYISNQVTSIESSLLLCSHFVAHFTLTTFRDNYFEEHFLTVVNEAPYQGACPQCLTSVLLLSLLSVSFFKYSTTLPHQISKQNNEVFTWSIV